MVKLDNFMIHLSRENGVYFPGEEVCGNLMIKSLERQKINRIVLDFKGETLAHWTVGTKNNRRHIWDRDTIVEAQEVLLQKQDNTNDLYIEEFEYSFPFRFTLPPNSLTSYEHAFANIRYWHKATIDIPWSINKHALRIFTVINPLDLNSLPNLRQLYGVSDTKILCCWYCKSEPIMISFNTSKTGYVPGETIIFNVSIDNRSTSTIRSISVSLVQHTNFIIKTRNRAQLNEIARSTFNGPRIGLRIQCEWENGTIKIPPVCPSLLETCRIVKIDYTLTLTVNVTALSYNKILEIPIVIGTAPLNDSSLYLPDFSNIKYYRSCLDRLGRFEFNEDELTNEERLKINSVEKSVDDELKFKPKYPYYKDFVLDKFSFCD